MKLETQTRVDVNLSLEADEARDLLVHLEQTTDEKSNNNVLAIAQHLNTAINGKPKKERDPNAAPRGRKPMTEEEKAAAKKAKEDKAAEAAKAAGQTQAPAAPAAPKQPANGAQPAQKPAQTQAAATPAPKQKVPVS